jgi:hypothetical protein
MRKKQINIFIYVAIVVWIYAFIGFNFFYPVKTKNIKLKNKKVIDDIYEIMKNENDENKETTKNSLHRWNEGINKNIQKNIKIINEEILQNLGNDFKYIPSMTELYWSSKGNNNSDKQYVSTHMDGPFYYCNVYRVLVTINGNQNINTVFPNDKLDINLKKYDISFFDYNKAPHYIYVNKNKNDKSQRIILKLHYVESPFKKHCEKVHCKFGRQTRYLFERNKKNLYLEGRIARTGLYYNTFRNYILFVIMLCILYLLFYNKNSKFIYLLYLFIFTEAIGFLYILHFNFISYKYC